MNNLASSLLALVVASTAVPVFGKGIAESELAIAGVAIGQHESTVIKRLGAPLSRTDSGEGVTLAYTGLRVEVGAGDFGVVEVVSTNAKYCTPSKLCSGMSEASMQRLYGKPLSGQGETGRLLEYVPTGSTCWLDVSAAKGIVRSLSIACQP